jgi:hypothetical protein
MPTCRPGSSVLDGLQPGRQAQLRADVDTSTSPLVVSNRFAIGLVRDWDGAPRSQSGTYPYHCHPAQTTPTTQYPVPSDRTPRYSKVGTWNVRGLKMQKHVHKPVDVSLTLAKRTYSALSKKRTPRYRTPS